MRGNEVKHFYPGFIACGIPPRKQGQAQRAKPFAVRWARVYRSYRLLKTGQAGSAEAQQRLHQGAEEPVALTAARKQLQQLTIEQELLYLTQDELHVKQQTHCRAWVFLRE